MLTKQLREMERQASVVTTKKQSMTQKQKEQILTKNGYRFFSMAGIEAWVPKNNSVMDLNYAAKFIHPSQIEKAKTEKDILKLIK
jgi:hypothetical protein